MPVIAVGATLPQASASSPAVCPTCIVPVAGAFASTVAVVGNVASAVVLAGAFNVDARSCGNLSLFEPAYVITGKKAVLTIAGQSLVSTNVTVGVGTFLNISALATAVTFTNVPVPNGIAVGTKIPATICFDVDLTYVYLLPLGGTRTLVCPQTFCYGLELTVTASTVVGGTGTLTIAGTSTGISSSSATVTG